MTCPKCGEELEDGVVFCTNCGEKLASVCPKCGKSLKPGAKFCSGCGAKLEPDEEFCSQCGTAVTTEHAAMDQVESHQTQNTQQMETDISAFEYEEDDEGVVLTGLKDKSLTQIVIPDSVTEIGYFAFSDCSSLTSIAIPNSVTNIGDYAFQNCI